jgi:uncharacterized membrane protein
MKLYSLYLMAVLYILAGANHFRVPQVYRSIMPSYLPWPNTLIYLSGIAEIGLGLLLFFPRTQSLAAWGIVALLVAVFPANVYMYQARDTVFSSFPGWLLLARLPLQVLLMAWAYYYTRQN